MFNLSGEKMMSNEVLKVEIHVTENCNLNCVCCEHFSPLAKEDNISCEAFESNLKKLKSVISENTRVNLYILGGEPTLHPELNKLLSISRRILNDPLQYAIRMVTNGVLLNSMNDEFWNVCSKEKIIISVTKYPIDVCYDSIWEKCDSKDIKYEVFHTETTSYMRFSPIDKDGKQNPIKSFNLCPIAHRCCFLKDNKIFTCPRIPNIHYLNDAFGLNIQVSRNDYIDLNTVKKESEIWEFLNKPNDFCKYCDVKNTDMKIKWKTSSREISEWIKQ